MSAISPDRAHSASCAAFQLKPVTAQIVRIVQSFVFFPSGFGLYGIHIL